MKKKLIFSLFVGLAVLATLVYLPTPTLQAQATSTGFAINGWSWSDNVGWFEAKTLAADSAGVITGYSWNDGIGWVNFAPGGDTPDGTPGGVKINGGTVAGFARACSVFASGCSGALKDPSANGGWDGWIKMINVTYDQSTGQFSGFAWGDLNIGWLDLGILPGGTTQTCSGPGCTQTCDPTTGYCGGGCPVGDPTCNAQNVTLTVNACDTATVISSSDGKMTGCSSGAPCTATYTAPATVTLNNNTAVDWTGVSGPICPNGTTCSVSLDGSLPAVTVLACPTQTPVGEITNIQIKTGQFGGIKFVKASGSPYPASSLPFTVSITGAASAPFNFHWDNAKNQSDNRSIAGNCQDIRLVAATTACSSSATNLDSVDNDGKYKLCFQTKCPDAGNSNYSSYNGLWNIPFSATYTVPNPDPNAPAGTTVSKTYNSKATLDFTDSTHQ